MVVPNLMCTLLSYQPVGLDDFWRRLITFIFIRSDGLYFDPCEKHRFQQLPNLASVLRVTPFPARQLYKRGDRVVLQMALWRLLWAASALVILFSSVARGLIQLYVVGVFVSFTLSQLGMIRHWNKTPASSAKWR